MEHFLVRPREGDFTNEFRTSRRSTKLVDAAKGSEGLWDLSVASDAWRSEMTLWTVLAGLWCVSWQFFPTFRSFRSIFLRMVSLRCSNGSEIWILKSFSIRSSGHVEGYLVVLVKLIVLSDKESHSGSSALVRSGVRERDFTADSSFFIDRSFSWRKSK